MGIRNRIRIGSAEVDTTLETERVQPGESIPATVESGGGSDDRDVADIELAVLRRYEGETEAGTPYDDLAIRVEESGLSLLGSDESRHTTTVGTTDVDESREQVTSRIDEQL